MDTVDFEYIIEDVLTMATNLGINAARGIELFLSRDGRNPIVEKQYDRNNHFSGTAREISIAWLEEVLAFAADIPSPPSPSSRVAARNPTPPGDTILVTDL